MIEDLRERVRHMNPIDDIFLRKMAEDPGFCQEVIRTSTGDASIVVDSSDPQFVVTNLQGRSVVLDVRCIDKDGKHVLVEVQKANDDDHVFRVRYNTSLYTANTVDPGMKFKDVPRLISIFISKSDFIAKLAKDQGVFEDDRSPEWHAVYHVDRIVRETGQVLDNGIEEIYVNASVKDGTDASEMMTIFTQDEAYDREKFPAISERKWRFKNSDKEVREMGYSYAEILDEGRAEGRAEGKSEIIQNMLTKGKNPKEISDLCGVPIKLVNEVQGSMVVAAK